MPGSWVSPRSRCLGALCLLHPTPPLQRVIRSRSQSMDAMGLSNKKPNTVSTSHSGSFAPNNPDLAKAAGIVSASLGAFSSPLPSPHPCVLQPKGPPSWALDSV